MLQILVWIGSACLAYVGYKEIVGLRTTEGVIRDLLRVAASIFMFGVAAFCVAVANHLAGTTALPLVSAFNAFGHDNEGGDLNKAASDAIEDVNVAGADASAAAMNELDSEAGR